MKLALTALCMTLASPAQPCELALLLAVDVSGSVDRNEYITQMRGLSDALREEDVATALVRLEAEVALMQWTGSSRQAVTLPWRRMESFAAVHSMADSIENDARIWRNFSTSIGEALSAALVAFNAVPDCTKKVVDVSGDGVSNEGIGPAELKSAFNAAGITVNAVAIETDSTDLTAYFFENVITGAGAFVMTADGFEDYPAAIKRKLRREVVEPLSMLKDY